ncbi:unnamed protein product [Medioppia subpectinata]|uniref:Sulfatase N-terminal domain-containing protein n=1 Tax=Medioppia subpectinata TaxID=1979941 RepID=A0A7R9L4Q8_9ACAR|nr:unnamed protein product [Medioppia subpectinata]CAG2114248.1 unnamed protein product [Medioppia subpectinata]
MDVITNASDVYSTDYFTDRCLHIIAQHNTSQPLFLYMPYQAVHANLLTRPESPPKYTDMFSHILSADRREFAAIAYTMDASIGAVMEALHNKHMLDNCIVIFVSDNGADPQLGSGNNGLNRPLRGSRRELYEGGIRVPALLWSPLLNKSGYVSDALIHVTDLLPTVLDAIDGTGIEDQKNAYGMSQWSTLSTNGRPVRWEIHHNVDPLWNQSAIRWYDWKLVQSSEPVFFGKTLAQMDYNNGHIGVNNAHNFPALQSTDRLKCKTYDILRQMNRKPDYNVLKGSAIECSTKPLTQTPAKCLNEFCLFNIRDDPCEQHDLIGEIEAEFVAILLERLRQFNRTSVPPLTLVPLDPVASDPALYNYTYVNWLDYKLINSGHRAVFAVDSVWSGKLTAYGIEEIVLAKTDPPIHRPNDPSEATREMMASVMLSDASALQKAIIRAKNSDLWIKYAIKMDKQLERLMPDIRPDVIVVDQLIALPAVELSGIPCVWCWSAGILEMMDNERAPPRQSDVQRLCGRPGCEPLPEYYFHNPSHYLNICSYPLELDYQDIRPFGRNYIGFDHFMRTERHLTFAVPPELAAKPGKLVYFSFGTIASIDVSNMRRLLAILAKSPHRFIVSKGPLHMDYTLADNMWGEESVPQIQVLPLVDLVLTHGAINTITESLYFGKPMIAMPVFGEQYDNAQRLQDKGFGLRLDAYKCSEEELLAAIETLLSDRRLAERLAEVSRRIHTDNSLAKVSQLFEDFVQNRHKYI